MSGQSEYTNALNDAIITRNNNNEFIFAVVCCAWDNENNKK